MYTFHSSIYSLKYKELIETDKGTEMYFRFKCWRIKKMRNVIYAPSKWTLITLARAQSHIYIFYFQSFFNH